MKRMTKLMMGLLLAVVAVCGVSCSDDDEVVEILSPANTWCTMPLSYKKDADAEASSLKVTFFYTDEDSISGLKEGVSIGAGITILVTDTANKKYVVKTYSKDTATEETDGENDSSAFSFKGTRTNWTVIYRAKEELRNKDNQSTELPVALSASDTEYANPAEEAESVLKDFSWKRLLKEYLLNSLIESLDE